MSNQSFVDTLGPLAVADYKKTGVRPSITIAQACLESGFGGSGLTVKANNLFGIKGTGNAGSIVMLTTEYVKGKAIKVNAAFRKYKSWGDSIADHSRLILSGTKDNPKRYHGVLTAKTYQAAAVAIWQGGYATDPKYPDKLIKLIQDFNLDRFDREGEEVTMDKASANAIIVKYLQPAYAAAKTAGERKVIGAHADLIRVASGQAPQNR
ncbi:glycoside hydrolase family 73 protein [Paenibacillus sp. FSL R7-0302]|uniref:glycoside hydrolase family 73 protein n=1 Tax=Paenibacillus sp. FSL R7-0302 TaxID=2921681 RepID=UPI0030FC63F3